MPQFIDLSGQTFNDWTFVRRVTNKGKMTRWLCRCVCGTERAHQPARVISGNSKGCGCKIGQRIAEKATKHGQAHPRTPEYQAWCEMRSRCHTRSNNRFRRYGGRGITVCERWNDYEAFLEDVGPRPSPEHSLSRIDNNGSYESTNVEWATEIEQQGNRVDTIWVQLNGIRMCLGQACDKLGKRRSTVYARVQHGWPLYEALLK